MVTVPFLVKDMDAVPLEPSSPSYARTSKIVIDATRQWPEEGGPEKFPAYSRDVLAKFDPEVFDKVDAKWGKKVVREFG
jgi:3-polyprenyl-4-hydroxybenzoate decarboxylase